MLLAAVYILKISNLNALQFANHIGNMNRFMVSAFIENEKYSIVSASAKNVQLMRDGKFISSTWI